MDGSSVPFEDRSVGFLTRFLETVKMAFAEPGRLFSGLPAENIGAPVLYGTIIGTISSVFGVVWNLMFGGLASIVSRASFEEFALSTGFMSVGLILSPVLVLVGLFISAGIFHVMLMIVGGARGGFGVTMRSVCYGSTPQLLGVVPLCGSLVGWIWSLVLVILAAIRGHRTDAWRVILAYFLPLVLCCCLGFYLASMFGLLGLAASD